MEMEGWKGVKIEAEEKKRRVKEKHVRRQV